MTAAAAAPPAPADGDVNYGPHVIIVTVVSTAIALSFVATRMYARAFVVRSVGWDDYIILGSAAFAIVTMSIEILSVQHGYGRHSYYVDAADALEALKWQQMVIIPNLLALMLARTSLCLFLLRIVDRISMVYRLFLWFVIVTTVGSALATIIELLLHCHPISGLWDYMGGAVCLPTEVRATVAMVQAVVTIASDWLVALFPILILKSLNMARKTKIALAVVMCMGIFVGICALVKTLLLNQMTMSTDFLHDTLGLTYWAIIEQNVGIIVVSVPAIRPLFSRVFRMRTAASKSYRLDHELGYDLGNMTGRSKGPNFQSTAATVTARNKEEKLDDNGSESSLVGAARTTQGDVRIVKTVSVSLHSHVDDRSDPELAGTRTGRVKGVERGWIRE